MVNRRPFALLALGWALLSLSPAQAESALEQVARTGELNAGTRANAAPFGYTDQQGKPAGYGVELLRLIQTALAEKLGKPVRLNLQTVETSNRFSAVESGKLAIVCEGATITQKRLETVDFSIPFFMSGAQFLIKRSDDLTFDVNGTLENLAIGYIPKTTTSEIIPKIYPFAKWIPVASRGQGIQKLNQGEIKAMVSDGILLLGELVQAGYNPRDYALTPRQPMTTELYGCILPKNNPQWKQLVDTVISSEQNHDLQTKWFNEEGSLFPNIVRVDPR
ncbi:MAG: transporter substrate-binding domain-containing protein [Cyanobacteria bacterium RI_101]|nr:transporter substrate-binding domain-containing protein [Cyanobacteria bacterium RI_101]